MKPNLLSVSRLNRVLHRNDWSLRWIRYPRTGQSGDDQSLKDLCDLVSVRALEVDLPRYDIQTVQIQHRALTIQQPQPVEFAHQFSITFLEQEDAAVTAWYEAWRAALAQIRFPVSNQRSYRQGDLKGDLLLVLMNRQLQGTVEYLIYGVWPQAMDLGQLVSDKGADIYRLTVTFSYDYFLQRR